MISPSGGNTSPARASAARASRASSSMRSHQRLDRIELQLRPDPADEGDVDRRAVEVAGKVEHMHFEQRRAVVEGRPRAEARDAVADQRRRCRRAPHRCRASARSPDRARCSRSEIRDRARACRPESQCRPQTTDSRAVRPPRPRARRQARRGSRTTTPAGLRPRAAARSRPRSRSARPARRGMPASRRRSWPK